MKNLLFIFIIVYQFSFAQNKFQVTEVSVNPLLIGNLYTPEKVEKPNLVIIIAGSGVPDRDGNSFGATNNSLKYLAEGMVSKGAAVYSFDKRTIAMIKSGKMDEENLTFDVFIDDVKDIITFFRGKKAYNKIILLGHSEGSLIGMMAAKGNADAYISIAGAGRTIDQIIIEQVLSQNPNIEVEIKKGFESLKNGKTFVLENNDLASLFRPSVQPYMISWIKYNPQEEIKKLSMPILLINGTNDIQVSEKEAELLKKSNPKAKLEIIDDMNHVLKITGGNRQENISTYNNPDLPISKYLISVVNDFINSL